MTKITIERANELEKAAEINNGRCPSCERVIKIYRYAINRTHANLIKALADEVNKTGNNNIDVQRVQLAYSVRSQMAKMRLHGLVARVKGPDGKQIARRWLITTKGWDFLKGKEVSKRVVVYNNQALGHDGGTTTIYQALGEMYKHNPTIYEETPVSPAEARTYSDVRTPKKHVKVTAQYKSRTFMAGEYEKGVVYDLVLDNIHYGKPIKILEPHVRDYADIAAFQADWKTL